MQINENLQGGFLLSFLIYLQSQFSFICGFTQIIANILSNAIKYGQTVVEVFLLYTQEKIEIIIEDDGLGIEDKQSVFELYQQSHKGLNSMEKKGTGIGLNFVKLLCEELDFQYRIEDSTALGGTKFILTKVIKEHKNV